MSGPPPSFLTSPELRLILFGGKGGVGKTTCATAAALRLARQSPDRPVALLSTDPAHSLRDSLADARVPWNLEVVELRAQEGLDDFRRRHGRQLEAIAERGTFLDSEDIHRFLSLSLPGMDELFAFLDIARRAERPGGDACTVVDTAPTGHTLRLLAMPELLRGWVNVLDTLLAKHRYMRQLFGRAPAPDELDRFLMELADSVAAAEGLLTDGARCRFVPVMIAEELSVRETATLLGELERQRLASSEVVVNQLSPGSECALCAGTRSQQLALLGRLPAAFQGRALFGVPLQPREVRGEAALGSFWDEAERLRPERAEPRPPGPSPPEIPAPPRLAEDPAPPPSPALKLVFFAGKGGVGKTTLACATALRLARGSPGSRILLFSTDPAHSVGDCLDLAVGPEPRPVVAGLAALEIDARADFEALKGEYRREIDAFFGSLLRNLDAPFDRAVMKQIIELSPPGLDEVMALTRAMDLLLERRYDLLVLDTAPTGHLVRLLEMPQLVSDWLKAFFEVLLKYRDVLGLPEFSERLVRLSKDLHRFRALLRDPRQADVYAVALPTELALAETADLLDACRRTGLEVPVLFVNRMTPPSGCSFCVARAREEQQIEERFAEVFAGHRTRVFRQPAPRGLERLEELGWALYRTGARGEGERDVRAPP